MKNTNKNVDYHYKACDPNIYDSIESKTFELFNEYGYNFDCTKRRIDDIEKREKRVKLFANRPFSTKKDR